MTWILAALVLACAALMWYKDRQHKRQLRIIEQKLRLLFGEGSANEPPLSGTAREEIASILRAVALIDGNFQMTLESLRNEKIKRDDFFANASHELKTPLSAIKGFNELTALNNKDENLTRFISGIARETGRMLSLIEDMLKLSELEAEDVDGGAVEVSLAAVIDEVTETLSTAISEKSLRFTSMGDGTVTAVQGHVYDVVKNLLENAVRYNKQGGRVSVIVKGDKSGRGDSTVSLKVADSGIGIPAEDRLRVFGRFYRVEKSRSVKNGGTGLGLAIVKHICALYDWEVTLSSKVGKGTVVVVRFSE